jgi:hypothetical protein
MEAGVGYNDEANVNEREKLLGGRERGSGHGHYYIFSHKNFFFKENYEGICFCLLLK